MNYVLAVGLGFVILASTMLAGHDHKRYAWRQPAALWWGE